MINQQINLFQDRFKEKKLLLSAVHSMMAFAGLLILLMISSYFYADMKQQQLARHERNLQQKEISGQRLEKLKAELQKLMADNQVDRQIASVSRDIKVRKRMIDFVDNNQFGSGEGFSDSLATLAQLSSGDLWLNEITLSSDYIKLAGSTLKAESVPEYFNQFQNRELFLGHVFDVFELGRDPQREWKLDFVIASRAVINE